MILTDLDGPDWAADEVVDLICVGAGVAVLAVAIAADRAGLDVLLTADTGTVTSLPQGPSLAADATAFLHEVSDDMVEPEEPGPQPWIRRAGEPGWPQLRPGVTFSGAALRNWAGSCVASSYGLLSTEVAGIDAEPIPVAPVPGGGPVDLDAWLPELAREHGLASDGDILRDLVLAGGRVVGAVMGVEGSPSARTVVRAVAGVVFSTSAAVPAGTNPVTDADVTELVIQPRPFSRFARLQLLAP